ncbi:hypothetical protein [Pseudoroseicyclus sp. CXY001]|uniref:hypothetical protein n=1 Tax=Pseudoroseicyclus sp. CXY001 TaxID=3242492 RepID=UPI00357125F8
MNWAQKLYAVALRVGGGPDPLSPQDFMVGDEAIQSSDDYQTLIADMRILSDDYHDEQRDLDIWHTHRTTSTRIMEGKVRSDKGVIFKRHASTWKCKLPNRGSFATWSKCKTTSANKDTQRFVMFYLAWTLPVRESYDDFPWDQFFSISDETNLAEFLNELR